MKFSIKKLAESKIQIEVELPTEEFNKFIEKATFNLGKELDVEGFRRGNVPLKIIEKEIGQAKILDEAVNLAIKENYPKLILENKIETISPPEIEILKLAPGNPFIFRAKTQILPEIKPPDYKKIASAIKRKEVLVEDKEVEEALSWFQKSKAKFILKPGPCQKGDWVTIKLKIKNEDLKISEPEIEDSFILGEGKLISDLEKKIEGMSAGQEKEFLLLFPENHYRKDLVGKETSFKVKIVSVQKMELPEIDDQFAKSLGSFENLTLLKKNIKEGINSEKEREESQKIRQEILGQITKNSELELPEILVTKEQNRMTETLKQNVSQNLGISFEEYLAKIKNSEKELFDSFLPEAKERIKTFLILREISKKENIEVSEAETEEEINKNLKHLDIKKIKELDLEKLRDYTREAIRNEKTFQFLESFSKK